MLPGLTRKVGILGITFEFLPIGSLEHATIVTRYEAVISLHQRTWSFKHSFRVDKEDHSRSCSFLRTEWTTSTIPPRAISVGLGYLTIGRLIFILLPLKSNWTFATWSQVFPFYLEFLV